MRSAEVARTAFAGDPPVRAKRGVVAAQHPMAAVVGTEILATGGNVVDAAVATAFASAVADVGRTGIGGYGGHLVYHEAASAQTWLVDFPSRAPRAAHERLFTPNDDRNRTGALAVGVPAVVAGLSAAHEHFGRLTWPDVLTPAIRLAESGIEFGPSGREPVLAERQRAAAWPETIRVFMDAWDGDRLRQPDLARSLRRVSDNGAREFYTGSLADQIVDYVRSEGGLLDRADLAEYEPWVGPATRSRYRSVELYTPGAGSGGGVLIPMLGALNAFDLGRLEPLGAERIGLLAATAGRVWHDRLARAGFVGQSNAGEDLLQPGYWSTVAEDVRQALSRRLAMSDGQGCTNHFSIADVEGNVVACTTTLQLLLGSAVTVPGTGILLNNAMGLFDPWPGHPNSVGPAKRAMTNMCPTVAVRNGRAVLSSGASGGRRIPSMLAQAFTLIIDHGFSVDRALRAPRFHHEGDGELLIEEGLSEAAVASLAAQGYRLEVRPPNGTALGGQAPAVWFDEGGLFGAPDPRRHGAAVAV
jgi:gamma-glutamyltranspeptidase / glutathione hydrolase